MATPNSGPLRVTRQSISHIDMPPATRPLLAHRPHTYPHPTSSSSQPALSSSESSSGLPPAPVIDPSLLAAPAPPPLVNGGINLAMVTPGYSPHVTSSSSAGDFDNAEDYFGAAASSSSAGPRPSSLFKDDKAPIQQWDGFTAPPNAPLPDWQQQPPTAGEPSRPAHDPNAPYDLGRKKDGKIARPPNAWILYRSEMLKHFTEGKEIEGLEAALEELENPTEDPKDGKKSKKSNKKAPAKGAQELIGQLGGGKGGRGLPQAEISRVISVLWKREDPERRRHYENLAAKAKEEHKKLYPGYKFQPMRKDEKAAHKAARQRERDVCRRAKAGDKAVNKITRRRNSRHKRSPSVEFGSSQLERTYSNSSQSSDQGFLHGVPFDAMGPHQGYPPYMSAAQPHSTPLMGHLMSTPFPSSSRSGSLALSLPGTSSSPEFHHDFGVEHSAPMLPSQSEMSYDALHQTLEFNDAPPMAGYSTLANGYGSSPYIPGRPLPYGPPVAVGGRLNHNIPVATGYEYTPMKVSAQYLTHVQATDEYTDASIGDLAAVWCEIQEGSVPPPAPAPTVVPATVGGQSGQTWAEHERIQGANMPRIPMAPPGAGSDAGYSVPQVVNQYENGSGGIATPQFGHLEVPRMATGVQSSPLSQPIFFDPSKASEHGAKPEHTPSPSMQHAMMQRAQGGDTLGPCLMPSPVDQSFHQNGALRPVQQGPGASPQPTQMYYDQSNSPSNMLVPRHISNSLFPLSPTGTQLPAWAQDRSFSSSSQQAQIMPSMSLTPGQMLGDDWDDVPKPPANLASPAPLSQSAPAGTMIQPSQRRVVTGYENPAV